MESALIVIDGIAKLAFLATIGWFTASTKPTYEKFITYGHKKSLISVSDTLMNNITYKDYIFFSTIETKNNFYIGINNWIQLPD
jgi:hypothetical protein